MKLSKDHSRCLIVTQYEDEDEDEEDVHVSGNHTSLSAIIFENVDFILSHFQEPIFPRNVMTKALGYQKEVFNVQQVLEYFRASNYEDCRINAYPSFTKYDSINRTPPSFLMIDIDLKDFATTLG